MVLWIILGKTHVKVWTGFSLPGWCRLNLDRFQRPLWIQPLKNCPKIATGYMGFPQMGDPQNGWFVTENAIKLDDLVVPLFQETSIWK